MAVARQPASPLGWFAVKNADYEKLIRGMNGADMGELYADIQAHNTPGWARGKAFEYLVPRLFDLDKARVRWPYESKIGGQIVEQIDGAIVASGLHCLIESKDEKEPLAIAPVAKMRNQLLRRPAATIGMIFSTSGYTEPAQLLTNYLGSHTILLWHPQEVDLAIQRKQILPLLKFKYTACVEDGIHDADATTPGIL